MKNSIGVVVITTAFLISVITYRANKDEVPNHAPITNG